jgi:hypothetical protein
MVTAIREKQLRSHLLIGRCLHGHNFLVSAVGLAGYAPRWREH